MISVTIIVPALEESAHIEGCLDAIAAQEGDFAIEVLVVDGLSSDGTAQRAAARMAELELHGRVLENRARGISEGLNVGLREANGDVIVRVDARSRIANDYVARAMALLDARADVAIVGGAQLAIPRGDGAVDIGIARALRNRWTTGMSRYRRRTSSGPSDTVWMGVFRTEELRELGGWDERFTINEDFDLASRYRVAGRVVWFDAGLRAGYLPRPDLWQLARQYFRFGRAKGTWWARGSRPAPRQIALLVAPVVAALPVIAAARSFGWHRSAVGALAAAIAVEGAGGTDLRAGGLARLASVSAIGTYTSSWWAGVVVGYGCERLGGVRPRG